MEPAPIGWLGPVLCGILLLAAAGTIELSSVLDGTPIEIFLRLMLVAIPIAAAMGTVLILTARRSDGTLKKRTITPRWLWLALLGVVLFTAGPLFIALPSVVVATILGCREGNADLAPFSASISEIFSISSQRSTGFYFSRCPSARSRL
jgi:hypothetical protein